MQSIWILWMTSFSSHSTIATASVSERSRLVTHTQLYPRQNAIVKRDPSLTVSRSEHYLNDTGIVVFKKIYIIRTINTGIRYEPVYRPALVWGFSDSISACCFELGLSKNFFAVMFSPHSTASHICFFKVTLLFVIGFLCFVLNCAYTCFFCFKPFKQLIYIW